MRRKKCRCCGELYEPYVPTYRRQKVCSKVACREWWAREKWRRWSQKDPLYGAGRKVKQKQWRKKHREYWRRWRQSHPGYVKRNCKLQKARDAKKRGFLAKPTDWKRISLEKLRGIGGLRNLAKPTDWSEKMGLRIDGILKYLKGEVLLAKPTVID